MRANYIEDAEPEGFPWTPGDSREARRRREREDWREAEADRAARYGLLCAAVALHLKRRELPTTEITRENTEVSPDPKNAKRGKNDENGG